MALQTFLIDEATVSVYPTDAEGNPITSNPVWLGLQAEGIRILDSLEEIEDRPSGVEYPEITHGAERHEVTITRLWEVDVPLVEQPDDLRVDLATLNLGGDPPAENGLDYQLRPNQDYVVVIVWEDESDRRRFHYRVYYGVTDRSHELDGRTGEGNRSVLAFRAKYFLA